MDNTCRSWRIAHSESSSEWGGQEHRILAEMKGFRRRGCSVALLAQSCSKIIGRAVDEGLQVHAFADARWQYPWAMIRCALWLRRFRPDVLNTHSSRDAWIVGTAGRLARVPFIVRSKHFDVPIPNRALGSVVYEKLADHLITTSPRISDRFIKAFDWPAERVSTIPTGVDTEIFSPAIAPANLCPNDDRVTVARIGMVGVLRGAKGHDLFLEAVEQLRIGGLEMRCFIVGDGPKRSIIERQIRERRLEGCVVLTGHREDVAAVLRALDLLVMPSRHEGVPQVGLQALASETPVVASNVGGIPAVIRPGETGRLFPANDVQALVLSIREALTDRAATSAMAKRGRAFVQQNHSIERMLNKLDALYTAHVSPEHTG